MALSTYDLELLKRFQFDRLLHEDSLTHALIILGKLPDKTTSELTPAILRVEKTALRAEDADRLISTLLSGVSAIEGTDIYTWLFGWLGSSLERPDVKINIIHPATEVHIRKYSKQEIVIIHETPELYERIVKPYIAAFPPSRTQWVTNILTGVSEAEKVLAHEPDPDFGYVILPDMKWDLATTSALYLVAIARSGNIHSFRDLTKRHLGMLRGIRRDAARIVQEKWGLGPGSLRMFVHYQPSYYHFHVHIVNANYQGLLGMTVGQAHMLDDIISLLECSPDDGPSILSRMTLAYGLGEQHGLFEPLKVAQQEIVL